MTLPFTEDTTTTAAQPAPLSPSWSLLAAETVTGRVVGQLPLLSQSWSQSLTFGGGSFTPVVHLDGPPIPGSVTARVRDIVVPGWRHMLVAVYGRLPIAYGYVVAPAPQPGSVSIGTTDLAGLLARRRIVKPGEWWRPSSALADTTIGPTSKANIARQLFLQSIAESGAALPIDVVTVGTSGAHTRVYPGYELASYAERLQDLGDDEDGPDIRVRPTLSADQRWVRLQVEIGEPFLGNTGRLHFEHPGSCTSVMPDYDFGEQAQRHYVPGDGADVDKPVGTAFASATLAAGVPLLERVDTAHGSVGDITMLTAWAEANAVVYEQGLEALTLTVSAAAQPALGTYGVGDDLTVRTSGHWWLTNGTYRRRAVTISGDQTDTVTIPTAPVPEGMD